jgi:L-lysine 2,3-aminomutase
MMAIEDYIYRHPKINEVILSGGDPLSLSDEKLAQLIKGIENIPHIKNLRIHTRDWGICVSAPQQANFLHPSMAQSRSPASRLFFMNNNWQHNARNTLKGADNCNAFFQSQQFQDQSFPIKIPLEFASLIDKDNPKRL